MLKFKIFLLIAILVYTAFPLCAEEEHTLTLIMFANEPSPGVAEKNTMTDFNVKGINLIPCPGISLKEQYAEMYLQKGLQAVLGEISDREKGIPENTKLNLVVIPWEKNSKLYLKSAINEYCSDGSCIIQIPTTWRFEISERLKPIPFPIRELKVIPPHIDLKDRDVSQEDIFLPFLFDTRYIALYDPNTEFSDDDFIENTDPEKFISYLKDKIFSLKYLPSDQNLLHDLFGFFRYQKNTPINDENISCLINFLTLINSQKNMTVPVKFDSSLDPQRLFVENKGSLNFVFADPFLLYRLSDLIRNGKLSDLNHYKFIFFQEYAFGGGSLLGTVYRNEKDRIITEHFLKALTDRCGFYAGHTNLLPSFDESDLSDKSQIKEAFPFETADKDENRKAMIKADYDRLLRVVENTFIRSGLDYPKEWLKANMEDSISEMIKNGIEKNDSFDTLRRQLSFIFSLTSPSPSVNVTKRYDQEKLVADNNTSILLNSIIISFVLILIILLTVRYRIIYKSLRFINNKKMDSFFENKSCPFSHIKEIKLVNDTPILSITDKCNIYSLLKQINKQLKKSEPIKVELVVKETYLILRWLSNTEIRGLNVESDNNFHAVSIDKA